LAFLPKSAAAMEPRAAVVVAGVAAAAFVYTGHACCTGTLPAPASPEVSDGISEAEVSEWASLLPKKTRLKGKPSAEQAAQLKAQKVEREARQQTLLLALSERLGQPPSALRPKLNQLAKAAKLAAKPKAAPARKPHAQPVPEAEQYSGPPAVPPSKYGASVELLGGPFIGEDMWLGGELAADGNIYGVPGTAKTVVKIDPRTDEVSEVGDLVVVPGAIRGNRFKWLRGARAANGDMFGIPCNANKVLRITSRGEVDMIGDPEMLAGHWKWHGGVLHANGNLYGCPCNSEHVLKIEPNTAKVTLVGGPFPGKQKWYGSLLGGDGCMYCIPNCAGAVLKFDPVTETHELLGDFPEGGWKWHGAAVGGDGNIYGVAAHVNAILKIVVSTGQSSPLQSLLRPVCFCPEPVLTNDRFLSQEKSRSFLSSCICKTLTGVYWVPCLGRRGEGDRTVGDARGAEVQMGRGNGWS
jgi:hypothetical protein